MIHNERIRALNTNPVQSNKPFVIYWMQASQRVEYNHALAYAVQEANALKKPVYVYFGITDNFPEANIRHFQFMLEGLREVASVLQNKNIPFVVRHESPEKGIVGLGKEAALVVTDRGYLRIQKSWRQSAAKSLACPLIQVESDVVVPVETASPKEEYAARTIRPKIHRHLDNVLVSVAVPDPKFQASQFEVDSLQLDDIDAVLGSLSVDRSVAPVDTFPGGTMQAEQSLGHFLEQGLHSYANRSSDPNGGVESNLSPYLHFGQISPLHIAMKIQNADCDPENKDAFLEQLIVRRELSMNFVFYNPYYDDYKCLPDWANATLDSHKADRREYIYTLDELESAKTHDVYWNAAQKEMIFSGKMHNYMRMYWGKKILEWTTSPEEAFSHTLYLNNKYELDGRDPNGFTGVAWCFGKHDRPWSERPVFGTVRYMNARGLERKFDIKQYVQRVDEWYGNSSGTLGNE